eukprot:g7345.t1
MLDYDASLLPTSKWLVLATFAYTSAWNAFFYMNFASISGVAQDVLEISSTQLNFGGYSAGLLTTLPLSFVFARFLNTHNWAFTGLGVVCNVAGAWTRYAAILQRSYGLMVLSSVLIGAASAMVICTYALLAERWFPAAQRTLATTLAVQSNYFGWLLGAWITPYAVKDGATDHKSGKNE